MEAKRFQGYFSVSLKRFVWFHESAFLAVAFVQPLVWRTSYMTCPSYLGLKQANLYAGKACSGKDLSIMNPLLLLDVEEFPKAGCVEANYSGCIKHAKSYHYIMASSRLVDTFLCIF